MDGSTFFVMVKPPPSREQRLRPTRIREEKMTGLEETAARLHMDAVLRLVDDAVKNGKVNAKLLLDLREQVTSDKSMLLDEYSPVIQSLHKIAIDDEMEKRMSKCKNGKDLILRFYEELQKRYLEEQKGLLDDIFAEVTEWVKQQK